MRVARPTASQAFAVSSLGAGSGFATLGGTTGSVGLVRQVTTADDGLSRTWRGLSTAATATPIEPKATAYTLGQKAEYFSDMQQAWFECTVVGMDAAGGSQVNINGHERSVPQEKLASHLRASRQEALVEPAVRELPSKAREVPPSLTGTWQGLPQEAAEPQALQRREASRPQVPRPASKEPQERRLLQPFLPPKRTMRYPSASPERSGVPLSAERTVPLVAERSLGAARLASQGQPARPFAAAATASQANGHAAGRDARSPAPPLKTGSYVAERPATQDTRQTASFTAMPAYKWGAAADRRQAGLRMRAVSGAHSQVGHKMRAPGQQNQDCSLLVPLSPGVLLAAVFDGHGAHGHVVSQFVRGVFERFANSLALLPESELAEGFVKVFNLAQESLEREGLADMAGTTGTVALINANSGSVTVAHVGDSTLAVFVGKVVTFKTKDHVVDDEAERYVNARGGDVRASTFDGVTAKRIYHKGEDSAGLGMARALGHTELVPLVINTPEVSTGQFSPGAILVIASDGIWEKIPPEALAEILAAQPPTMTSAQAGSLARTLVAEARQRWHGDIDDITAVVVRAVPDVSGGSLTAPGN